MAEMLAEMTRIWMDSLSFEMNKSYVEACK